MALKTWMFHPQDFALYFMGNDKENGWLYTDYHELIGDIYSEYIPKAKRDRKVYYIFVSMPPRSGKTIFTDEICLPWCFNLWPFVKVLLLTHTMQLSREYSIKVREFIKEYGPQLRVQVSNKEQSADEWATLQGGRFKCAGLGTGIQGKGYNVIVLDDLIKNRMAANSEAIRAQIRMLLTGTIRGRFDPRWGIMLVPMTRWDNQDPAAYIQDILTSTGRTDQLVMLNFPAFSLGKEKDLLGRQEGEPLGPIFTKETLEEIRDFCTPQEWWAQYMGMPKNDFGSFFPESKFRYFKEEGSYFKYLEDGEIISIAKSDIRLRKFQFWDTALLADKDSDYSACATIYLFWNDEKYLMFIYEVWRDQVPVSLLIEKMQWKTEEHSPLKVFVEWSPGIEHTLQVAEKQGIPLYSMKTKGKSKEERAIALQHHFQCKSVFFLKDSTEGSDLSWRKPTEDELISFPGRYKDRVDALVHCAFGLNNDLDPNRKETDPYYGLAWSGSSSLMLASSLPTPEPDDEELWR